MFENASQEAGVVLAGRTALAMDLLIPWLVTTLAALPDCPPGATPLISLKRHPAQHEPLMNSSQTTTAISVLRSRLRRYWSRPAWYCIGQGCSR